MVSMATGGEFRRSRGGLLGRRLPEFPPVDMLTANESTDEREGLIAVIEHHSRDRKKELANDALHVST